MEKDFLSMNIEYTFRSFIGSREAANCIKEYRAVLYEGEFVDNTLNEYAGEVDFKLIYLDVAQQEGFDIEELFDTYEYTYRHGQSFYDFNKGTFKKPLLKTFPDLEFSSENICIIETIGVIPKFRGKGLGAKAFKDIIWNFSRGCDLFIIQPFPLQFEHPENGSQLFPRLALDDLAKDERKATLSLSEYYQSWGFQKITGIKDLLFYCPLYQNDKFEAIDMDDY